MDERLAAWLAQVELDDLWRLVLRRPIEPDERAETEARLAAGLSRSTLIQELATSPEFEHAKRLDDVVAWAAAQRATGARPRNLVAPAGTDERLIEIPWCLARYNGEPRLLDVGYAYAERAYLAGLVGLGAPELTGVDLVTLEVPGLTSVQADLRDLPFENKAFDVAFAISTLEHVGRDNTQYGLAAEADDTLEVALRELRRVAVRVLVTVPTGERQLLPEQTVYAPSEWVERFEAAGFAVFEDELYELTDEGWHSVPELGTGVRYGERGPAASGVLCAELHADTLGERARMLMRDLRYRGDVRRVTG